MKYTKKAIVVGLAAVASIGMVGSAAQAQTFTETTDAGQTLATADPTAAGAPGTPLTEILGSFSSASDADLFVITITTPSTFKATTVNTLTATSGVDTALFLFDSSGHAIETNDDASGTSIDSTLPSGSTLLANLTSGTYFLGISSSGNEPINSASQLLFNGYPGGDTTAVRGPASGVNPTTLSTFNSNEYDTTTSGPYEIDLTSAATAANPLTVPEPSSWAAVALGGVTAGFAFLRRRRSVI